jgi:stage IV sporulation protein FB
MGFRLGSIPVKIHFSFFLTAVILSGTSRELAGVAQWTGVIFVSVMLHELGHALMGRIFGLSPRIDLHGMGGTTSWTAARGALTPMKSILISVAGPGVGIVLGAIIFALLVMRVVPADPLAQSIANDLVYVNAGWGFVNLLPVLPMDGGNVLFAVLNAATKGNGERPTRIVSMAIAVIGGALAFLVYHQWWPALLAALFAYDNFRALRALSAAQHAAPTPLA